MLWSVVGGVVKCGWCVVVCRGVLWLVCCGWCSGVVVGVEWCVVVGVMWSGVCCLGGEACVVGD